MIVEVLPLGSQPTIGSTKHPCTPEQWETAGLLVVTSRRRLRNPLVRYLTGDVGSIHKLSVSAASRIQGDSQYLRVLMLHGGDARTPFKWEGEYIELSGLRNLMSSPRWGILRWRVVLKNEASDPNSEILEVRMLRRESMEGTVLQEDIELHLKNYSYVHERNNSLFHLRSAAPEDFVCSESGNKVLGIVGQRRRSA